MCWEIFTGGKAPYAGVHPLALIEMLEDGHRLNKPRNAACSVRTKVLPLPVATDLVGACLASI